MFTDVKLTLKLRDKVAAGFKKRVWAPGYESCTWRVIRIPCDMGDVLAPTSYKKRWLGSKKKQWDDYLRNRTDSNLTNELSYAIVNLALEDELYGKQALVHNDRLMMKHYAIVNPSVMAFITSFHTAMVFLLLHDKDSSSEIDGQLTAQFLHKALDLCKVIIPFQHRGYKELINKEDKKKYSTKILRDELKAAVKFSDEAMEREFEEFFGGEPEVPGRRKITLNLSTKPTKTKKK